MEHLFFECSVRAALIMGAAAIVLSAMKVKEPTAKHQIWTGVLALMLMLPIWMSWGPKASLRILPTLTQASANQSRIPIETLSTTVASTAMSPGKNPRGTLTRRMGVPPSSSTFVNVPDKGSVQ